MFGWKETNGKEREGFGGMGILCVDNKMEGKVFGGEGFGGIG